ncbi:MAG: T9SS type A sorting domain-containing protein, partial [Chloroherpetonaceae bacterium]
VTFATASGVDNPLPVNFGGVRLVAKDARTILVEWQTVTEQDNLGFILYRKEAGGVWEEIASYQTNETLRGKGTTLEEQTYRYEDRHNLQPGRAYTYKLVSVDFDGTLHEIPQGDVEQWTVQLPFDYALDQNYPNPFNPVTTIQFSLAKTGKVTLEIFNILGQKVGTLVDGTLAAGAYRYQWNATGMASGVYFYRLRSNEFVATKKMLLVK